MLDANNVSDKIGKIFLETRDNTVSDDISWENILDKTRDMYCKKNNQQGGIMVIYVYTSDLILNKIEQIGRTTKNAMKFKIISAACTPAEAKEVLNGRNIHDVDRCESAIITVPHEEHDIIPYILRSTEHVHKTYHEWVVASSKKNSTDDTFVILTGPQDFAIFDKYASALLLNDEG